MWMTKAALQRRKQKKVTNNKRALIRNKRDPRNKRIICANEKLRIGGYMSFHFASEGRLAHSNIKYFVRCGRVFSRISRMRLDCVISLVNKKQISFLFCFFSISPYSCYLIDLSVRGLCNTGDYYRNHCLKINVTSMQPLFCLPWNLFTIHDKTILYIASRADHLVDGKQPRKIIVWLFVRAELVISLG